MIGSNLCFSGSSVLLQRAVAAKLSTQLSSPWVPPYLKQKGVTWRGKPPQWQREVRTDLMSFLFCTCFFSAFECRELLPDTYSKTCVKGPLKKKTKNWFSKPIITKCRSKVLQNAPREHSAILLTFIKLPFVFKTFVLYIFEWPLKTGFTVHTFQGCKISK